MKTLTFQEYYFKNNDEWIYFLSELGITNEDAQSEISEIEITVDGYEVTGQLLTKTNIMKTKQKTNADYLDEIEKIIRDVYPTRDYDSKLKNQFSYFEMVHIALVMQVEANKIKKDE
jgi:hypothetical protein